MKRKSLLALLLSVLMVLFPALCTFAESEAADNTSDNQQEVVVDLIEGEDASTNVEGSVAEEKAVEEADKASEEQPVMKGEPKDVGCSHINKDTYFDWNSDEVEIEEIEGDDCNHKVIGDIYIVTYCEDCGEDLYRKPYGDNEILVSHDYGINHVCTLCGHENECEHEEYFEWYDYDPEQVEYEDEGDTHSVTGHIFRKNTCEYCEEDFEIYDLGYTTISEEHDYENGVCDLCGHKRNENWSNNGTYYYDANGKPVKGWQLIDGDWYYFDKSSGVKKTGWFKDGSYWYYLDPAVPESGRVSGAMVIGWKRIGSKMYYFKSSGKMMTGWLKIVCTDEDGDTNTDWYYFNSSGAQAFGWQKISGKWYYFEEEDALGFMYHNDWLNYNDKWYFFDKSGAMKTGWLKQVYDYGHTYTVWYYFNSSGAQIFGWQKISGKWYFFPRDKDGGMATGPRYDYNAKKTYLFASNGVWSSGFTGWYNDYDRWYYFRKGVGVKGWQKISNKWYYFGEDDAGYMYANMWAKDSKGWYWMDENGHYVTNTTIEIGGEEFTFGSDGICENPPD